MKASIACARRSARRASLRRSTLTRMRRTRFTPTTARAIDGARPRTAGSGCSSGSAATESREIAVTGAITSDVSLELRRLLESRALTTVFQPIYAFREAGVIGFETLVRGPQGTALQTPAGLFAAAAGEGL